MTAELQRPWWRRVQWVDVLLVIIGVLLLLMVTMEWSLPHYGSK